jgi:surface antigen
LFTGGCSFSYQLDSLFGKSQAVGSGITGTLASPRPARVVSRPAEGDLAIARAAAREVLAKGRQDASMPWENPRTGARGTVTPIARAYNDDGLTCRDFLASYVRDGNESWLQGEACRHSKTGRWEVRQMKPWQRT